MVVVLGEGGGSSFFSSLIGGCADCGGSISVSSLCVHPATLRLDRRVETVNVSERHLLCAAPLQRHRSLCQPFLRLSVRTVAVNDISTEPGGHRGKAKASGKAAPPMSGKPGLQLSSTEI